MAPEEPSNPTTISPKTFNIAEAQDKNLKTTL